MCMHTSVCIPIYQSFFDTVYMCMSTQSSKTLVILARKTANQYWPACTKECIRYRSTLHKNAHTCIHTYIHTYIHVLQLLTDISIWYKLTHRVNTVNLGCHDDGVGSHSRPHYGTEGLVRVHSTRSCRGGGGCGRLPRRWGFYRNKICTIISWNTQCHVLQCWTENTFRELPIRDGEGDIHVGCTY